MSWLQGGQPDRRRSGQSSRDGRRANDLAISAATGTAMHVRKRAVYRRHPGIALTLCRQPLVARRATAHDGVRVCY